jgi:F-type H+-transporting ATPase subunit delta
MKHLTLAKPYSDAAFLFAKEHKQIDLWRTFLSELASVLMDAEIQHLMKHPKLSNDGLIEILSNSFAKITPELKNFLKLLGENDRLNILPEISELFEADYQEDQKIAEVNITFAEQPTETELNSLKETLAKKFGAQIHQTITIDSSLLSGVIIHSGDCVIDASLRGQLENLKTELMR